MWFFNTPIQAIEAVVSWPSQHSDMADHLALARRQDGREEQVFLKMQHGGPASSFKTNIGTQVICSIIPPAGLIGRW